MILMEKMKNLMTNNIGEKSIFIDDKEETKFKKILETQKDKNETILDKNKENVKSSENKKDKKSLKIKEDDEENELKIDGGQIDIKSQRIVNDLYIILAELLEMSLEDVKEYDISELIDKIDMDLLEEFNGESLIYDQIDLTELKEILKEDFDNINFSEIKELKNLINDKVIIESESLKNGKIKDEIETKEIDSDLKVIENKEKNSDEINDVDPVESKDALIETVKTDSEVSDDSSDEKSKISIERNNQKNKEEPEEEGFESQKTDGKFEFNEPTGLENIIKKENTILVDFNDNMIENPEKTEQSDIVEQIISKMEFDLSDGNQEVKINLKPDYLGEMIMNLEVLKSEVVAKITVDNYRAKEALEANLIILKEELEDAGMEIKSFQVFVGQDSDFGRDEEGNFNYFERYRKNKNNKKNKNNLNNVSKNYESSTIKSGGQNNMVDGRMDLQA